jgi:hypothetical protein
MTAVFSERFLALIFTCQNPFEMLYRICDPFSQRPCFAAERADRGLKAARGFGLGIG